MTRKAEEPQTVVLADGRTIRYAEYGDAGGSPALWCHNGGSSRLEGAILDKPASRLGLRLIVPDRPGVGGSDPHPGKTVPGYASDIAELLDHLGIRQIPVGGLGNGGMYAMAIASRLPDRVLRVVPMNPATPVADQAARAALPLKSRLAYAALARNPQRAVTDIQRPKQGRLMSVLSRLSSADTHVVTDPARAAMLNAIAGEAAAQPSTAGLVQEFEHAAADWGFDHRGVTAPVFVVCGEKDPGLGYSRVWATELPAAQLVIVPGGQMNLFEPEVADTVVRLLATGELP